MTGHNDRERAGRDKESLPRRVHQSPGPLTPARNNVTVPSRVRCRILPYMTHPNPRR